MQSLFGQVAFVRHMQVEELAAGVGHAANFGDAQLEAGVVARGVIADQLAVPCARKLRACSPARLGLKS